MQKEEVSNYDVWDNPDLKEAVDSDNELKSWLVEYVGNKHNPSDGNVTVQMIVDTLADEFPEFVLAVAGENFLRGYHQALCDVETKQQYENQHNTP
jgi:hypothetical protein